ncbi:MAG TPA: hypothetical protein VMO88_01385 [Acidimicrobiales bacterium]|nr:hypothetical protein [Acidimicrobiales bacterium]
MTGVRGHPAAKFGLHVMGHDGSGGPAASSLALLLGVTVDRRYESTTMPIVVTYFS